MSPRNAAKGVKQDQWRRGYFCAVAMLCKMEGYDQIGTTQPDARELFFGGGDWHHADPEDIETFRKAGLLAERERSNQLNTDAALGLTARTAQGRRK